MSDYAEKYLKEYLCSHCHIAILAPHETLHGYIKCPVCGFTKKIEKDEKREN